MITCTRLALRAVVHKKLYAIQHLMLVMLL